MLWPAPYYANISFKFCSKSNIKVIFVHHLWQQLLIFCFVLTEKWQLMLKCSCISGVGGGEKLNSAFSINFCIFIPCFTEGLKQFPVRKNSATCFNTETTQLQLSWRLTKPYQHSLPCFISSWCITEKRWRNRHTTEVTGVVCKQKTQQKPVLMVAMLFSSWHEEYSDFDFRIISSIEVGQEVISPYTTSCECKAAFRYFCRNSIKWKTLRFVGTISYLWNKTDPTPHQS